MQLDWRVKSTVFRVIDKCHAHSLLYSLQKNVTGRAIREYSDVMPVWNLHKNAIDSAEVERPHIFEFGAGRNLAQNLYLAYANGGKLKQTVVDLFPMLDIELTSRASSQIAAICDQKYVPIKSSEDLKLLNIEYIAPFDAASRFMGKGSIDCCISTNTLEHIPEEDIIRIFRNIHKMMVPGGVVSAKIDYTDHYAHTDKTIGSLNYLRFTEQQWKKHNTHVHYQNRLRHQDHRRIFIEAGFEVVEENILSVSEPVDFIVRKEIADDSESYIEHAHFVLRKKG